jgi:protein-S-isoprenylcysteine O-methyltransferase Ste14
MAVPCSLPSESLWITFGAMNPDHTFRNVLLLWALLWFPDALFYRIRSLASVEKLDRRKEGLPILLTLRPLGAREEQQLLARFGEPYLAYTQQTGRFLPRMRPSRVRTS